MNNLNTSKHAVTQYNADAKLLAEFEHSGTSFNYNESVISSPQSSVPEEQITAYLSKIQRGGLIQSFGCLLAIEEPSFKIIAYSENTIDLLGLKTSVESRKIQECLLGFDARSLFTMSSAESLMKVLSSQDISLSNPVSVVSEIAQIPFLAILHRVDVGVVIDMEPVRQSDLEANLANKLALQTILRLQSLPHGDMGSLCDTLLNDVRELTGYDRVMVYKFHEDEHGEVVAEIRRPDLEPYLGIHFLAVDIPQAARFLFKKSRVRMICDFEAATVGIIQSEELKQSLILVNSTLRAPHACHIQYMAKMGSRASLVMAIIVNENGALILWGLVSCHHHMSRNISFPIRQACEFIVHAFGVQLSMKRQLVLHTAEKKMLKLQAKLSFIVLKDDPFGIVTIFPSVMDYVSCNGAAFYYGGVCRVLGVTPTEMQIKDIIDWLLEFNKNLAVWSTDSLVDAGYKNAYVLGDGVCGMAVMRIMSKGFFFWFRPQVEQEVRWGGVDYHHRHTVDDDQMQPISSFKAFLEVVKNKSFPWKAWEINAIHSLQNAVQESFQDMENNSTKMKISSQEKDLEMDKLAFIAKDTDKLLEMAVAPIFEVNIIGNITRWNSKIAEITGLPASSAIGKCFVNELVHEESRERFERHLSRSLQGEEVESIELRLRTRGLQNRESVFIVMNACSRKDFTNNVVSVCFIGQDVTDVKLLMEMFDRLQRDYKAITESLKPLIPPIFVSDESARCSEWNASMEKLTGWEKSEVIGKLLPGEIFGKCCRLKGQDDVTKLMILLYQTCCKQDNGKCSFGFFDREGIYIDTILTTNKRIDVSGHVDGCFCVLQTVPNMEQNLHELSCSSSRTKDDFEYIRQEIKSSLNGIQFTTHKLLLESSHITNDQKQLLETSDACERQMIEILKTTDIGSIEDWMIHLGEGLPLKIVKEMFEEENIGVSKEGFGLRVSRKLLGKMNGNVQYIREPSKCYFLIDIEFQTIDERCKGKDKQAQGIPQV
ncbi:Phytochrome [Thalictrum thalictroides]|uniref:Phytochrome n=1 Tax=Thalictrum thalictroides TaxID=46969 RepID=A0A7J6VYZ7_THATH|nr:Phytochrome [Thalictrum thalictroides]